jgi:hypothetical protein
MPQLIRSYQVLPCDFEYRQGSRPGNAPVEMNSKKPFLTERRADRGGDKNNGHVYSRIE